MIKDTARLVIPDRNLVTVETYRAGKLRQRAKTHNLITEYGVKWLKYKRDYGLNTGIAAGKITHGVPVDCFNTIVALADSSQPSFTENYNLSEVIAWANKTAYTGVDTKRGTVNLLESTCDDNKIHWVVDFPQHAGNANIINSVAWHYYNANTVMGNPAGVLLYDNTYVLNVNLVGNKYGDNAHLYNFQSSTLTKAFTIYKISLATGAVVATYGPFNRPNQNLLDCFFIVGNIAYYYYSDSGSAAIYSTNLSDGTSKTEKGLTYSLSGLTYDGVNFWGSKANNLIKFNNDFTENTLYPTDSTWVYLSYDAVNDCFFLGITSRYYKGSKAGKILMGFDSTSSGGRIYNLNNKIYQIQSTADIYAITWESQGARALLPVPIEKTAADTMRITYDFDIRY